MQSKKLKVAMTDMDILWEDKESNKVQCKEKVWEAAGQGADLILFPEMTLTGFSKNIDRIRDDTQESIYFFADIARTYHIAIGFGYVTKPDQKGRNHFCLLDQNGVVLADYEKIHPFSYGGEADVIEGGRKLCPFRMGDCAGGLFICYDLRFPESFWQLPEDTNTVFIIANWPKSRLDHWYTLLKARAIELQCYVVGVNRTGDGDGIVYPAQSSVAFAPDGSRLPETAGNGNRYVELDFETWEDYVRNFSVRKDRRPEIYIR